MNGFNVIVDRTCLDRRCRIRFVNVGKMLKVAMVQCVNFGPGDEKSLDYRLSDLRGLPRQRWRSVHSRFMSSYNRPSFREGFDKIVFILNIIPLSKEANNCKEPILINPDLKYGDRG